MATSKIWLKPAETTLPIKVMSKAIITDISQAMPFCYTSKDDPELILPVSIFEDNNSLINDLCIILGEPVNGDVEKLLNVFPNPYSHIRFCLI